jgi:hypothetical protein
VPSKKEKQKGATEELKLFLFYFLPIGGKDPDPYKKFTHPGGPKTYGSGIQTGAHLTLSSRMILTKKVSKRMPRKILIFT